MTSPPATDDPAQPGPPSRSATEIRNWLVNRLSEARHVEPVEIRADEPLIGMGLDSMQSVVLIGELEQWLGCRFTDNPLVDHPTIDALSVYLSDQIARGHRLIDPTQR